MKKILRDQTRKFAFDHSDDPLLRVFLGQYFELLDCKLDWLWLPAIKCISLKISAC